MSHEAFLRGALAKAKYRYPDQTKQEVLNVFRNFNDLRPQVNSYVFNDGTAKELLCLDGTIPVNYKGKTYNIPIIIYLLDTHPYNPPLIYVKPTATMQIKQGRHVDAAGRVYLPYLHEWKHPSSDMMGVIQVMAIIFGDEPPVFSKQPNSTAGATQPPYPVTQPMSQPPYPATAVTQSLLGNNSMALSDEERRLSLLSAVEDKMKSLREILAQAQAEMDALKKTQEDLL